ncbi:MAG: hypothetical protein Q4C00_08145, partial [Bacillota bacterium]|nr:hypothetical protein [Bacillota bacterium]
DYTMMNFNQLYSPRVGSRSDKSKNYFKESIDKEMERLLRVYDETRPREDAEAMARVKAVLAKSGMDMDALEAKMK